MTKYLLLLDTAQGCYLVLNSSITGLEHRNTVLGLDSVDGILKVAYGTPAGANGLLNGWDIEEWHPHVLKFPHPDEILRGFIPKLEVTTLLNECNYGTNEVLRVLAVNRSILRFVAIDMKQELVSIRSDNRWSYV